MSDRKYGKDEIQQILKKAAEKQKSVNTSGPSDVGLTLEEIVS